MVKEEKGNNMGKIKIQSPTGEKTLELADSSLFGRHPICHGVLHDSRVPLYWVELRWIRGGWGWRALNLREQTRGPGYVVEADWKLLPTNGLRPPRISCSGDVSITLLDSTKPRVFLQNLNSGEEIVGEENVLKSLQSQGLLSSDQHSLPPGLSSGETLIMDGDSWRLFIPGLAGATQRPRLNLSEQDVKLDIHSGNLSAVFSSPNAEVEVKGEFVRTLLTYAHARRQNSNGGWLDYASAFTLWLSLGGNAGSSKERLGWERGKIRTRLSSQGAMGTKELFSLKRKGNAAQVRLVLDPGNISIE